MLGADIMIVRKRKTDRQINRLTDSEERAGLGMREGQHKARGPVAEWRVWGLGTRTAKFILSACHSLLGWPRTGLSNL